MIDSRKCSVVSDAGTILYVGYGAGAFDRVLTTKPVANPVSGDVRLGPATVGCHKPDAGAGSAWAMDCM